LISKSLADGANAAPSAFRLCHLRMSRLWNARADVTLGLWKRWVSGFLSALGLVFKLHFLPTPYGVGCILSPLRGWFGGALGAHG
jgi:hypothetical protein